MFESAALLIWMLPSEVVVVDVEVAGVLGAWLCVVSAGVLFAGSKYM